MYQTPPLNRRDFLKLLTMLPTLAVTEKVRRALPGTDGDAPGVIIIVLDALSALNLSLHGYPRNTSPNLERFAQRATVYHAHYSTANFTTPGTASLLTGTYPWRNRAFHYEGLIKADQVDGNLFTYWGDSSHRLGYTQNPWVDLLLYQFAPWLDEHIDSRAFNLDSPPFYTDLFRNDPITAFKSIDSTAVELEPGLAAAPILAFLRKILLYGGKKATDRKYINEYPIGIPQTVNDINSYFLLEDVFDGLMQLTATLPPSALAYLHLYPPHYPYSPRGKYLDKFDDGWHPESKPRAPLLKPGEGESENQILKSQKLYDSYIATADEDFGRMFDFMELNGILDRYHVVLTSDHGEIHERGVIGHTNEYLYEPLIRVPLIISSPGQAERVDIHTPTSSVDVVPTLLALTGRAIPPDVEGQLLPGLGGEEDADRLIFCLDAKSDPVQGQIGNATISMRRGRYKLIGYYGYEGYEDGFELFDLDDDPDERINLTTAKPALFTDLKLQLEEKLHEVNTVPPP